MRFLSIHGCPSQQDASRLGSLLRSRIGTRHLLRRLVLLVHHPNEGEELVEMTILPLSLVDAECVHPVVDAISAVIVSMIGALTGHVLEPKLPSSCLRCRH